MPPIQTVYNDYMDKGYPGAPANARPRDFFSRTCEDTGMTPFGVFVKRGTTERTITKNLTGATSVLALTVLDRGARLAADGVTEGFAQYDTAHLAAKGSFWVTVSVAVVADTDAYVTPANPGLVTNVATNNIRVGKFETSADANGLAIVNVNL